MADAEASVSNIWEWPTDLTLSTLTKLSEYEGKDQLYTSVGLALGVYFITKRLELACVALIYFVGAKGGTFVKACVVAGLYAWKRNNIMLLGAIVFIWYLLSGFKL